MLLKLWSFACEIVPCEYNALHNKCMLLYVLVMDPV